ncbi:hypothetical protein D3C87_1519000 [compost metagenome]
MLDGPVQQALQLMFKRLAFHAQDQVAAVAADADDAGFGRRRNRQAARLHGRAALAQRDQARALQRDADQVVAGDVARVDLDFGAVVQIKQRGVAEEHAVQPRLQGFSLGDAHAVRPQMLADLILDLGGVARVQQAMAVQRIGVVEHAFLRGGNSRCARRIESGGAKTYKRWTKQGQDKGKT